MTRRWSVLLLFSLGWPIALPARATEASPPVVVPQPTETPAETGELPDPPSDSSDRQQVLIEADRLWQQGQQDAAAALYRKVKDPFVQSEFHPEAIVDANLLPPGGQVYWREAQAGLADERRSQAQVALELLVNQFPQFIPGQIRYAEWLATQEQIEEAIAVLDRAAIDYPDQPDLIRAQVQMRAANRDYLEASIAARQFALLYPQHSQAAEFLSLAATNLEEFQDQLQRRLTGNAIANALVGTLGFALTGGLFGPLSAVQTTMMMLQGETAVGNRLADRAREQLPLVEDEAVTAYINEVGQRMAAVTGRDDFTYEFYVVRDPRLNAFALPGGKVFVNAGAILESNSEAELAGLLAHELSHAVLSHGFQLMTSGNLTANLLQWVPYGGLATNLAVMSYSRDMERQADGLGTRMLVSAGYAADGLHNLMVTLDRQDPDEPVFSWLSSHPDNEERIRNLETVIDRSGYNRFAFEGVERHQQMQQRVQQLIEKQWPSAEPETAPSAQPSDP